MDLADRILALLYDRAEGLFTLAELAEAVGAGRARLAGALAALKDRGQRIETSIGGAVRLVRPVALDGRLIERGLSVQRVGRSVLCFSEVDSTNDVAFASAAQGDTDGLAVLAESQRKGRGRLGRRWLSKPGGNVLLSVLLTDADGRSALAHEAATVAAGLAAAEAVEEAFGLSCELKWPNDVLLEGRKLAGVLGEVRRRGGHRCLVIGIGVNVNSCPPARQVDGPATCIADHRGEPTERTELVQALLRRLDHWVADIQHGRLAGLHRAWLARCGMVNQRLTVRCAGRRHTGRVLDIDPLKGLVLCGDDGRCVYLPAEKASIEA